MPESFLRLLRTREAGLLGLNLLLLAAIAPFFPAFLRPGSLAGLLDDTALLILLALGEMLVLLTRGVDLSIAANLAFTGMVVALLDQYHPGLGLAPVLILSVLMGAALGAVNGLLVWRLRIPSIVVTLGTLSIYRGAVYLASGGRWVNSNQMSPQFLAFVRLQLGGVSMLSWIAIACAVLVALFLRRSVRGRDLYAAGNNPSAALYAGIDVGVMQFSAFLIAGAIAGLCGYLWVSRYAVAYTDVASGFELQVIAACVIGGVSISGGVGSVAGVVLGALFLGIIKNALPLVGVSPFFQMAVSGVVITGAVLINARGTQASALRILERRPA
ncbi:ABC transporter permease [Lichenicoccus roseus]|uniref:Autoinducer 2 import system permease protein LsrC n=1 Tax=Lichenicoccus roseus TaxID=2683649 RepID=A0A5R9JF62_9PROT|nr:ABC transporter permease [Lichenicoccus roseus]TLU74281.1 ABC transporter permease [Lichenicoccus roseus]